MYFPGPALNTIDCAGIEYVEVQGSAEHMRFTRRNEEKVYAPMCRNKVRIL
jgi:hypothetical protein